MLTLEQARALLLSDLPLMAAETMPIADCSGRVLASDIRASRDQPPEAVSSMDGYAVRSADAIAGASLIVIGEAPAGAPFVGVVGVGEAVRIATGGALPRGADTVVVQENVTRTGNSISIEVAATPWANVRAAGIDFAAGAVVARAGEPLTPARHALVAAANVAEVQVYRQPTVAIFPTGDELREPGSQLGQGQIANSATYALAGLVERWGAKPIRHAIVPDDEEQARRQLEAGLGADVIVTIGGASVGDRDVVRPLFESFGARILFDRVAVQPGKPTWHARLDDGPLVLGLPGNPVSAYVCAHLFLTPLLYALTGRHEEPELQTFKARLLNEMAATGPREVFVRGEMSVDDSGQLIVSAEPRLDSSLLTPLAASNALIRRRPHSAIAEAGSNVDLIMLDAGQ
jgi:molybdopterin molybdotransferase